MKTNPQIFLYTVGRPPGSNGTSPLVLHRALVEETANLLTFCHTDGFFNHDRVWNKNHGRTIEKAHRTPQEAIDRSLKLHRVAVESLRTKLAQAERDLAQLESGAVEKDWSETTKKATP